MKAVQGLMKITLGQLLLGKPPDKPERVMCGAKTRAGTPCRRLPAVPSKGGRCSLHEGKSRNGIFHPNYKHGLYAKPSFFTGVKRQEWWEGRAQRKRERIDRVIDRRYEEWRRCQKTCVSIKTLQGARLYFRQQHMSELEERRARYVEKKRLKVSLQSRQK
jgi:hypothetical protein